MSELTFAQRDAKDSQGQRATESQVAFVSAAEDPVKEEPQGENRKCVCCISKNLSRCSPGHRGG